MLSEANLLKSKSFKDLIDLFNQVMDYSDKLIILSDKLRISKEINQTQFFSQIPLLNIYKIEENIEYKLDNIINKYDGYEDQIYLKQKRQSKHYIAIKLRKLMKIFKLTGARGQCRLAGEEILVKEEKLPQMIHSVLKEISLLNQNMGICEYIIIANYTEQEQYDLIKRLIQKYDIRGVQVVPLLETFASSNDTDSKITMLASSDTRQRDGLLLTELRALREYKKNPEKIIYMGQGNTPERGGGPYTLTHQKLRALTKSQKQLHIRTIQGHYFTSEFLSRDLAFTFLLNGCYNVNTKDNFEPTQEYMDFLFELDGYVGAPLRYSYQSEAFNKLYVDNPIVKGLVESFNYSGSRDKGKKFDKVKGERAIPQAYVNSDRCSYTHPELAYWDKVPPKMINQIHQYYYENNVHFKYILFQLSLQVMRYDLTFASQEVSMDTSNPFFQDMVKGKAALQKILDDIGLGTNSTPVQKIWKEHLGLFNQSSDQEMHHKEKVIKSLNQIQNQYCRQMNKARLLNQDQRRDQNNLRIIQCALANITSFSGKG